jgi:molybdopterin converting factor subunit 1
MQVRVLFFGMLKEITGQKHDSVSLPENATLGDLLDYYEQKVPRLKEMLSSIALSVNEVYAGPESPLKNGDEVALLPPVSGGTANPIQCTIVRQKINTQEILDRLKHPADGAAIAFEGIVRNHTRGRRTLFLDYEAYENMALKQMRFLAEQALAQFKVREVAIIHRLGRLEIGETSVLIAVASAHRAAAFDACRWLIDALKRRVPIWKKESFEDGTVWADGEPFPAEIPRAEGISVTEPASKLNNR